MNSEKILNWVNTELTANRNDTVHDFLAYLAEQMIEMNDIMDKEGHILLND